MNQAHYERGREIVQNAPQLYVDLDVEADGKPGYGSLLSVGAVTPWGDEFYRELKPTSEVWTPHQRKFCEDHNLERTRLLREGIHPAQAMRELETWTLEQQARYEKAGSVLTAFNASFDYPWIDLQMIRARLKNPYGIAGYCIKSLAQAFSQDRYDWRETSKGRLPADTVPDGDFTHNALEDARYQQKIHFAMAGKLALAKKIKTEAQVGVQLEIQEIQQLEELPEENEKYTYHYDSNDGFGPCTDCHHGEYCKNLQGGQLYTLTDEELKESGRVSTWTTHRALLDDRDFSEMRWQRNNEPTKD